LTTPPRRLNSNLKNSMLLWSPLSRLLKHQLQLKRFSNQP
jgi:hypothetical protein